MPTAIPLKVLNGSVQQFGSTDDVFANGIEQRTGTTLTLGSTATTINVGSGSTTVNIPGTLSVTTVGQFDGSVDLGDGGGGTINVGAHVEATGTLTGTSNFANGETVTTGSKTYTFQTVLTNVDGNVLIGGSLAASLQNLYDAINLSGTPGTQYALATTANTFVTATSNTATTVVVAAIAPYIGTDGNSVATTDTAANASWGGATLSGGTSDTVQIRANLSALWLNEVTGSGGDIAVNLRATGGTTAGAYAIGTQGGFTSFTPSDNSVAGALSGIDTALGSVSAKTLDQVINASPTPDNDVNIPTAAPVIWRDNAAAVTDLLSLRRTYAGAGEALDIQMGASATGTGVDITHSGSGAAIVANAAGSGNALQVQDGGTDVLVIDGNGAVTFTPTSGQNFQASVTGAGTSGVSTVSGNNSLFSVSGDVLVYSGSGDVALDVVTGAMDLTSTGGAATGGAISINATATSGTAGDITIASRATSSGTAGDVYLHSQSVSGTSGGIAILSGVASVAPASGAVDVTATAGVNVTATNTGGAGSDVTVTAGNGQVATNAGGDVTLTAGNGNTTGAGGAVSQTAGNGGATGVGGDVNVTAGAGGATSGNGGNVVITGGTVTSGLPGFASVVTSRTANGTGATDGYALGLTQAAGTAGIWVGATSPNGTVSGTAGSIYLKTDGTAYINTGATAWTQFSVAGGTTLQTAYDSSTGAPVTVTQTATDGGILFDRGTSTDAYVLGLTDTSTEANPALSVSKVPSGATASAAATITAGANLSGAGLTVTHSGTGTAVIANAASTGNAFEAQDNGTAVFTVTGAGAVTAAPTSGEDFTVTTAGAGGDIDLTAGAGAFSIDGAAASNVSTTAAALTVSTITSGTLSVTSAGALTASGAAASSLTTSAGALTITSNASATWSSATGSLTLDGNQDLYLQAGGNTAVTLTAATGDVTIAPVSGGAIIGTVDNAPASITGTNGGSVSVTTNSTAAAGGDATFGTTATGNAGGDAFFGAVAPSGAAGGVALQAGGTGFAAPSSGQVIVGSTTGLNIQYQANDRIVVTNDIEHTPASGADYGVVCTGAGGDYSATTEEGTITIAGAAAGGTGGIMDVYTSATTGTAGAVGLRSRALASGGTSGDVTVGTTAAAGATAGKVTLGSAAVGSGVSGDVEVVTTTGSTGTVGDVLISSYSGNATTRGGISIRTGTAAPATPAADEILIVADNGGNTAAITFEARGSSSIGFNEIGNVNLDGSFTATSIIGALNELKTGLVASAGATVVEFGTSSASAGDVVKITGSDTIAPADADDGEAATIGIQINGSAPYKVVTAGEVTGLSGLTAGSRYFVSATAGALTTTAPSSTGQLVRRIGWARTATAFVVSVGEGYIV